MQALLLACTVASALLSTGSDPGFTDCSKHLGGMETDSDPWFPDCSKRLEAKETGSDAGFIDCSKCLGVMLTAPCFCLENLDLGESSVAEEQLAASELLLRARPTFPAAAVLETSLFECKPFSHPLRALVVEVALG